MFGVVIYYLLTENEGNLRPKPEWPVESQTCPLWPFFLNLKKKYVKSKILNIFLTKQLNFLDKIIKL